MQLLPCSNMGNEIELNSIQLALYALIERFIQRQSLVLQAMRDLRPDLVIRSENKDNLEYWTGWTTESWQAFILDYRRRPATGYWGEDNEWEYFLHGAGCRLTHKITDERIEWDLGSLLTFDRSWFVNYLESLLGQDTDDETVAILRIWYESEKKLNPDRKIVYSRLHDAVFLILEQLNQMGLLSQHQQYYTLVSQD